MKVIIAKNYEDGARKAADIIEKIVRENPTCTLGLATGSSPVGMYRELARRCKEEGLDFSKVHSVNLDEYVGLDGTHDQSYRYFMNDNEPGDTLYDGAHEETLDDSTIEANKRFFASKEEVPTHAVTMGMGNIMRAARLLMIISGNKQEAATKLLIENKIDPHCPCTFMRLHRDATVIIEQALADQIGYKG